MTKAPKTIEELQKEMATVCYRLGQNQYAISTMERDNELLLKEIQDLDAEFITLKANQKDAK